MAYSTYAKQGLLGHICLNFIRGDTVPRRIENMLREGLPSKIYWYAFPEPVSGYEIAKRIYKPIRGRAETSKIYPYTKSMIEKNILTYVNNKIQSNPEPLALEMEKDLKSKDVSLTETEKKRILRILQNEFFRGIVLMAIQKEHQRRDIDAIREISNILGVSSIVHYFQSRSLKESIKELARGLNQTYDGAIGFDYREFNSTDPVENFLNYLGPDLPVKLIRLLPVDLEKILGAIEETQKKMALHKN